jgi:hypothetical protein
MKRFESDLSVFIIALFFSYGLTGNGFDGIKVFCNGEAMEKLTGCPGFSREGCQAKIKIR